MFLFQPVRHSLLLVASLLLFSACQRTSYSFQRVEAHSWVLMPFPSADTLTLPAAAPEPAPTTAASPRLLSPYRRHITGVGAARPARSLVLRSLPMAARLQPAQALGWHRASAISAEPANSEPVRQRSRTTAIVLAILAPFGLYNFYLGYYGRGALAIALWLVGSACCLVGFGALFFGTTITITYVGLVLLLGLSIWQVSDLIRIITGKLKPRNGEYIP